MLAVAGVAQVKTWEEKAQVVAEERAKHRAALETELRTLRAVQDELAAKFDDSLSTLQTASPETCNSTKPCAHAQTSGCWGDVICLHRFLHPLLSRIPHLLP